MIVVLAHVGGAGSVAVSGSACVAAAAYALGTDPRDTRHRQEIVWFGAGLATTLVALLGPLDEWADGGFAPHMVQHILLIELAAPLLVLGAPGRRFARSTAPAVGGAWHGSRPLRRRLRHPAIGWAVLLAIVWAWHAPAAYDLALRSEPVHGVEHASMLAAALWYWSGLLHAARTGRHGTAAISLATTGLHTGALGALLVFAGTVLIPSYASSDQASALHDQQLAGLWMWIAASPVILGGVLLALQQLLVASERSALHHEGALP